MNYSDNSIFNNKIQTSILEKYPLFIALFIVIHMFCKLKNLELNFYYFTLSHILLQYRWSLKKYKLSDYLIHLLQNVKK